jgi:hypothetical protein
MKIRSIEGMGTSVIVRLPVSDKNAPAVAAE